MQYVLTVLQFELAAIGHILATYELYSVDSEQINMKLIMELPLLRNK